MSETHINAYKAELVQAEIDLDRAKTRVEALKDYIKAAEPETPKKSKKAEVEETIKATDTANESRPVVEDSLTELPDEDDKVEVQTSKKGKK